MRCQDLIYPYSFTSLLPYVVSVSTIRWAFVMLLFANLAILTHSLMFALRSLNTDSAINSATSFSMSSSLSKTLTATSTNSSLVYGLRWMTVNLVNSGANNLSASLTLAKTHVFNWVALCCLCFNSDNTPDYININRPVWSLLLIFSISSIMKYLGLCSNR